MVWGISCATCRYTVALGLNMLGARTIAKCCSDMPLLELRKEMRAHAAIMALKTARLHGGIIERRARTSAASPVLNASMRGEYSSVGTSGEGNSRSQSLTIVASTCGSHADTVIFSLKSICLRTSATSPCLPATRNRPGVSTAAVLVRW